MPCNVVGRRGISDVVPVFLGAVGRREVDELDFEFECFQSFQI